MKVKTYELLGPALDWAVVFADGQNAAYWLELYLSEGRRVFCQQPSTNWSQGGPIIERERITIRFWENENEEFVSAYGRPGTEWIHGPAALIAAMRCYVASKLGEEVDVPDELA